jgi:hypothetical protein
MPRSSSISVPRPPLWESLRGLERERALARELARERASERARERARERAVESFRAALGRLVVLEWRCRECGGGVTVYESVVVGRRCMRVRAGCFPSRGSLCAAIKAGCFEC